MLKYSNSFSYKKISLNVHENENRQTHRRTDGWTISNTDGRGQL